MKKFSIFAMMLVICGSSVLHAQDTMADYDGQQVQSISNPKLEYRDGTPWLVIEKDGLVIAQTITPIKNSSKWAKVDLVVSNRTSQAVYFDPMNDISAYAVKKNKKEVALLVQANSKNAKKVQKSPASATMGWDLADVPVSTTIGLSATPAAASMNENYVRDVGYLKSMTIYPGETITGCVNIQKVEYALTYINLTVNNSRFFYTWRNE